MENDEQGHNKKESPQRLTGDSVDLHACRLVHGTGAQLQERKKKERKGKEKREKRKEKKLIVLVTAEFLFFEKKKIQAIKCQMYLKARAWIYSRAALDNVAGLAAAN